MSRRRRPLAAVALSAAVALISGCGSSTPAANSAGHSGGSSTAAQAQQGVKFTLDAIVNGSSLHPDSPAFIQALGACKSLEPAGFAGGKRSTLQESAALKFAECIRNNGVPDFPDPVNGQPLVDTNLIPSARQPGGMAALNAAMAKCRSLRDQAIGDQ